MSAVTMQGFGDSATWALCAGHPHDPRTPDEDGDDTTMALIVDVRQALSIAEIAYSCGNLAKAIEALREAARLLDDFEREES